MHRRRLVQVADEIDSEIDQHIGPCVGHHHGRARGDDLLDGEEIERRTVFSDLANTMGTARDEIFGPEGCVNRLR